MSARPRGRPTDRSSGETKATILRAAQTTFGAASYQAASMEQIGRAAGVDPRTIHYHFGSKRGLFEAATEDAVARFGELVVDRVFRHQEVKPRLLGYLDVYRALAETDPSVVRFLGVVLVDSRAEQDVGLMNAGDMLEALIGSLVDDAIEAGEVTDEITRDGAVHLISAIGMGLSLVAREHPDAFGETLDALGPLLEGRLFR